MPRLVGVRLRGCLLLLGLSACQNRPEPPAPSPAPPVASESPRPVSSTRPEAVVTLEKSLQASKLRLPARRGHEPRLAFGRGVFARLVEHGLEVYEDETFRLLESLPLEAPRALLTLADGALLAAGGRGLVRWELGKRNGALLPKPVVLPDSQLYADARVPDRFWIFDQRGTPPTLSSFRVPSPAQGLGLLLAEQVIPLTSPRDGVLGTTREGVWLYLTPGHADRFGPGGARLASLTLGTPALPSWVLPARRVDQSLWVYESGELARVLVSPSYQALAAARLAGAAVTAETGDEGQLLAVLEVTGEGPRFELELFDSSPARVARLPRPGEAPTGNDDWVRAVTRNQELAVAAHRPRVAVGGPDRFRIFDGTGNTVFSKPSM